MDTNNLYEWAEQEDKKTWGDLRVIYGQKKGPRKNSIKITGDFRGPPCNIESLVLRSFSDVKKVPYPYKTKIKQILQQKHLGWRWLQKLPLVPQKSHHEMPHIGI